MNIAKLGHCCLVVEVKGYRVMTDPGAFSDLQKQEKNIDIVVITHEHQDHYHLDSLRKVLENNPNAKIITNGSVGKLLVVEGINFTKVSDGEEFVFGELKIKGFGSKHAEIYEAYGSVENTGYLIDRLCFPGDAFEDPREAVDFIALPITGPWMVVKDAIDYAKKLKPKAVFPVHDAHIQNWAEFIWRVPKNILESSGINFVKLELGKPEKFD